MLSGIFWGGGSVLPIRGTCNYLDTTGGDVALCGGHGDRFRMKNHKPIRLLPLIKPRPNPYARTVVTREDIEQMRRESLAYRKQLFGY